MQYNFQPTPNTQDRIIDGLSVTSAGRIGLPKHFLATHRIERGARAILYWDASAHTLAIEFTHKADAGAYPLRFTQRYGGFINAARFFRNQQINPKEYVGRYSYVESDGPNVGIDTNAHVFIVDLRTKQKPEQEQEADWTGND